MAADQPTAKDLLEAAHEAVREANLPEGLQAVALGKAFDLLAAQAGIHVGPQQVAQPTQQVQTPSQQQQQPERGAAPGSGSLQQIATKLGIDLELIEHVYLADGGFQVIVPPDRLPDRPAPAMRELIFLTVLGRQAGGWDSGTTAVTDARAVCEHYGGRHYDPKNFTNAVKGLSSYVAATGKRDEMTLRVLPGGYREGANLVRRMGAQEP